MEEELKEIVSILYRIQCLCENPHWEPSRKERIRELACQAKDRADFVKNRILAIKKELL